MTSRQFIERIKSQKTTIGIIGLGYVGLPLAREFCTGGVNVVGVDIDPAKVRKIMAGESYVRSVDSEEIARFVEMGRLRASCDHALLRETDAILICVPTPLTRRREPDLSYVRQTASEIAKVLQPGQLVVLESTTYPGSTDEVLRPILEGGGLRAGVDFFLAYSPEREDPGNPQWRTRDIPKVVGADDPESLACAEALYAGAVTEVVTVSSTRTAEATKILENIYRCVNIALVNELKGVFECMGIDIWEVVEAAATKPFGFQPFYPGPGLGGHCIPVDPFYLSWKAREFDIPTRFIELAGEVNVGMPRRVVDRLQEALNDRGQAIRDARVLIMGVSYKENVDDIRESPALKIIGLLRDRGAAVSYSDPYVPELGVTRDHSVNLESLSLEDGVIEAQDAVLIVTAHDCIDYSDLVARSKLVVDTRNATAAVTDGREKIVKA